MKLTAEDYFDLGILRSSEKRFEEAIRLFTAAIDNNYKQPHKCFAQRGIAHGRLRNFTAALADFDKSLEIKETLRAYYFRCYLKEEMDDIKGVEQDAAKLLIFSGFEI
jgi:tetratricopeptide (TPR) repeat protein